MGQFLVAESGVHNVYRVPSVLVPFDNKSTSQQVNKSKSSREIWRDRGEDQKVRSNMKQISPVQTCLHPMKTQSNMDKPEDLSTHMLLLEDILSTPSSELCRFRCPSLVRSQPA